MGFFPSFSPSILSPHLLSSFFLPSSVNFPGQFHFFYFSAPSLVLFSLLPSTRAGLAPGLWGLPDVFICTSHGGAFVTDYTRRHVPASVLENLIANINIWHFSHFPTVGIKLVLQHVSTAGSEQSRAELFALQLAYVTFECLSPPREAKAIHLFLFYTLEYIAFLSTSEPIPLQHYLCKKGKRWKCLCLYGSRKHTH